MQCILKIILFFFVSEYLRRPPMCRESNERANESSGFVGITICLWYMYKPLVATWWKAAGFGVLAFDLGMYLLCWSGDTSAGWGTL